MVGRSVLYPVSSRLPPRVEVRAEAGAPGAGNVPSPLLPSWPTAVLFRAVPSAAGRDPQPLVQLGVAGWTKSWLAAEGKCVAFSRGGQVSSFLPSSWNSDEKAAAQQLSWL